MATRIAVAVIAIVTGITGTAVVRVAIPIVSIILVLILPLPATWIMLPLLQSPAERDLVRAVRHRSRSCAT